MATSGRTFSCTRNQIQQRRGSNYFVLEETLSGTRLTWREPAPDVQGGGRGGKEERGMDEREGENQTYISYTRVQELWFVDWCYMVVRWYMQINEWIDERIMFLYPSSTYAYSSKTDA